MQTARGKPWRRLCSVAPCHLQTGTLPRHGLLLRSDDVQAHAHAKEVIPLPRSVATIAGAQLSSSMEKPDSMSLSVFASKAAPKLRLRKEYPQSLTRPWSNIGHRSLLNHSRRKKSMQHCRAPRSKMKNKSETEKNAVPPCYHAARVHHWSALPFCNSQLLDWGNGKVQSSPGSVYT